MMINWINLLILLAAGLGWLWLYVGKEAQHDEERKSLQEDIRDLEGQIDDFAITMQKAKQPIMHIKDACRLNLKPIANVGQWCFYDVKVGSGSYCGSIGPGVMALFGEQHSKSQEQAQPVPHHGPGLTEAEDAMRDDK